MNWLTDLFSNETQEVEMADQESKPADGEKPEATEAKAEGEKPAEQTAPETFPREYVEQLRAENAGHRKRGNELEARLDELESRDKTEAEKATAKALKSDRRADEAEGKLLRYQVAVEKRLKPEDVEFLSMLDPSLSREQLEAAADALTARKAPEPERPPQFDGGAREPAPEPSTPEERHNKFLGDLFGQPR